MRYDHAAAGSQVTFVGESAVAVAGTRSYTGPGLSPTQRRSRSSGFPPARSSARLGVPSEFAGSSVDAAADGRILMAYTGDEFLEKDKLQIRTARATLRDPQTGSVIARSPALFVERHGAEAFTLPCLPGAFLESATPTLQLSQSGQTVLSNADYSTVEVFALRL